MNQNKGDERSTKRRDKVLENQVVCRQKRIERKRGKEGDWREINEGERETYIETDRMKWETTQIFR
jgi:hypothetical protein